MFLAGSSRPRGSVREGRQCRAAGPHRASWRAGQHRGGGPRGKPRVSVPRLCRASQPGPSPALRAADGGGTEGLAQTSRPRGWSEEVTGSAFSNPVTECDVPLAGPALTAEAVSVARLCPEGRGGAFPAAVSQGEADEWPLMEMLRGARRWGGFQCRRP